MKNLKSLRDMNNLTQQQMADLLGIQRPTYSRYENGERQPDFDLLCTISQKFNVSIDYLLGNDTPKTAIQVPVLGRVAAGVPIEAVENVIDYEELDPEIFNPNYEYFGLKLKGDSMSPRMMDGDVVIVRKQPDAESGDIAIVLVNGNEATCKQLKKHDNGISLIAYNSAYEPMFFTKKEISELPVTIIGKVVELRAKF